MKGANMNSVNNLSSESSSNNSYSDNYQDSENCQREEAAEISSNDIQNIEETLLLEEYKTDRDIILKTIKEDIKNKNYEDAYTFVEKYRPAAKIDDEFEVLAGVVDENSHIIKEIRKLKTLYEVTDSEDIDKRAGICKKALKIMPLNKFFRNELYKINTGREPSNEGTKQIKKTSLPAEADKNHDNTVDKTDAVDKTDNKFKSAAKSLIANISYISLLVLEVIFIICCFMATLIESFLFLLPLCLSVLLILVHRRTIIKTNYKDLTFLNIFTKLGFNLVLILLNLILLSFIMVIPKL